MFGFSTTITSRKYMSTIYGELNYKCNTSWLIYSGQLVRIKLNCFEQTGSTGIIIECVYPDFGTGHDKWLVLTDGKLKAIESFKIWPVEEI